MDYKGIKNTTPDRIAVYSELSDVASLQAISAAINITETKLAQYLIAANTIKVGSTFRVTVYGTCTSTAANVSNIRIRIGVAGTSADAIAAVVAPTAAISGTAVPFTATLFVTIRTIGTAGTMGGNGNLLNNGVTGISNAAVVVGVPTSAVTINTTVANIIQISYASAAATTTSTFQIASIEVVVL